MQGVGPAFQPDAVRENKWEQARFQMKVISRFAERTRADRGGSRMCCGKASDEIPSN
jgi:hypothetical protein